jgi:putative ABC transport system permease protein
VLGASVAKEMFGSALDAYDETIYIDDRPYVVNGVLEAVGTVSSGISPDEAVFIPYATMEKYLTGSDINPTITIIAEDVDDIDNVIADAQDVLALTYPNTEFTYTDAGSKMEAATQTNSILTVMLYAMAAIVFVVGGIGIMNVLSLSVKERTREIGVLKSIGCSKADILLEFLLEACLISIFGGVLGVGIGVLVEPLVEYFNVSVILTAEGGLIAVAFATLTGTVFGFYPALQASRLIPIEALSSE